MKTLIVGGTGLIGINAALHLRTLGHEVTLAARSRPSSKAHPAHEFPLILGDFSEGDFTSTQIADFEAVVFSAGNDPRHLPSGADAEAFYRKTQSEGVPTFARLARDAGVRRFVQLGSYYHQLRPDLAKNDVYIRARQIADVECRALATEGFAPITLNPPSIVGTAPGLPANHYRELVLWGRGKRPKIPNTAPPGGTNYMSVRSLAQAIGGALVNGKAGQAYLVGDENLSFRDFFQLFFDAAGNETQVETRNTEHPLMPDAIIFQGRGNTLAYEPPADEVEALGGYARGDVRSAVAEVARITLLTAGDAQ